MINILHTPIMVNNQIKNCNNITILVIYNPLFMRHSDITSAKSDVGICTPPILTAHNRVSGFFTRKAQLHLFNGELGRATER